MNLAELPLHIQLKIQGVRNITAKTLGRPSKGHCTWCLGEVKGKRRTWCSNSCVEAYNRLIAVPTTIPDRDGWKCAKCHQDIQELERARDYVRLLVGEIAQLEQRIALPSPIVNILGDPYDCEDKGRLRTLQHAVWTAANQYPGLFRTGATPQFKDRTPYEIDHIIPVSQGGTTTADNLMLLCAGCHKLKTAQERKNEKFRSSSRHVSDSRSV